MAYDKTKTLGDATDIECAQALAEKSEFFFISFARKVPGQNGPQLDSRQMAGGHGEDAGPLQMLHIFGALIPYLMEKARDAGLTEGQAVAAMYSGMGVKTKEYEDHLAKRDRK